MEFAIGAFCTSLFITFFAIPSIIKIAEIKHLFDVPDERKTHKTNIPTLGGLAIFAGIIFSICFWSTQKEIVELQYIICSIIIFFFIGMKDDLFNLVAYKKLAGQLVAVFILVHWAGIRITSFFGIFGVHDLSLVESYVFSVFSMIVISNSFNLIDGIDLLAGTIGILATAFFGFWFFQYGQIQYTILAASLIGSLMAFLYYNRPPAKIFMGDTGSLIVGVILSILAIKFIEMNRVLPLTSPNKIRGVPVMTIAILIIPLFDTLRVFTIRALQGKSPFSADRNHLHHLFVDQGLSHSMTTLILAGFNILMIVIAYFFQSKRSEIVLTAILMLCGGLTYFFAYRRNQKAQVRVVNGKNVSEEVQENLH